LTTCSSSTPRSAVEINNQQLVEESLLLTVSIPVLVLSDGLLFFLFSRQIKMAGTSACSSAKAAQDDIPDSINPFRRRAGADEAKEEQKKS
jgi:ATP-dependent Zn protease